jgi:hypothetical protein
MFLQFFQSYKSSRFKKKILFKNSIFFSISFCFRSICFPAETFGSTLPRYYFNGLTK